MTFFEMLHQLDMLKGIVLGVIFFGWCNIWTNVGLVLPLSNSLSIITFHMVKSDATSAWWVGSHFSSVSQLFAEGSNTRKTIQNKTVGPLDCPQSADCQQSAKRVTTPVSLNHVRKANIMWRSSVYYLLE